MKSACFALLVLIVCCSDVSAGKDHSNPEPLPMIQLDESKHAVAVVQSPSGGQQGTERAWADKRLPADLDLAPAPTLEPLEEVPASDVAAIQGNLVLKTVNYTAIVTVPVPKLDVWQPYMGNSDAEVPQATFKSGTETPFGSSHGSGSKQLLSERSFRVAAGTNSQDEAVAHVPNLNVLHPIIVVAPTTTGTYGDNAGGYGGHGEPGSYGYSGQAHGSYQGTLLDKTTVLVLDIPADFNPEDNSLKLAFKGTWVHDSNDYNAAFTLELVDSNNIEVLTYESPVVHHRANRNGEHQQREAGNAPTIAKFNIDYSTVYRNVLVTPGENVSLKLTTGDSYFQDFSATIDLDWKPVSGGVDKTPNGQSPPTPSPSPAVQPSPEAPTTSSPEPPAVQPSPEAPTTSSPEPPAAQPSPEAPTTSSPEPPAVQPSPEAPTTSSPEPPAVQPSPEAPTTSSPEPPAVQPSPEAPITSSPEPPAVQPSPEAPTTSSPEPPAVQPSPEAPTTSSPEPPAAQPSPEAPTTSSPEPPAVQPSPEAPTTSSPEPPAVQPSPEAPTTSSPEPPAVQPSPEAPTTSSPEPPAVQPSPEAPTTSSPEPPAVQPSPEAPTTSSPQPPVATSPAPRNPSSPAPPGGKKPNHGGKKPNHGKNPKHNKNPKQHKQGDKSSTGKTKPVPSPKPALKDVKPQIPNTPVREGPVTQPQVDQRGATNIKVSTRDNKPGGKEAKREASVAAGAGISGQRRRLSYRRSGGHGQ